MKKMVEMYDPRFSMSSGGAVSFIIANFSHFEFTNKYNMNVRCLWHSMEENRNVGRALVEEPRGRDNLENLDVDGE